LKAADQFTLHEDRIDVISASGSSYQITLTRCSCKGYSFHQECRHYKQAVNLGLLEKLKAKSLSFSITLSDHAKKLRKEALKEYLTKQKISFTEDLLCTVEPQITCTMKPSELIALCLAA